MKKLTFIAIIFLTSLISTTIFASPEHRQLKAFPEAMEGMQRLVINLSLQDREEEDNLKVELVPGKVMMSDGINVMRHSSHIESHPLQGWGYTFYRVTGQDITISTKMAVPEGTQQKEHFVSGKPLMISYNSRVPIVIYTPLGYEVHYRIWRAPAKLHAASQQETSAQ